MSWLMHHNQSEWDASQAEKLKKEAIEFYRLAAESEVKALNSLPYRKARTIGVTVISAVSLYCKAQEFVKAREIAHKWLATDLLPAFAVKDLENLLQMQPGEWLGKSLEIKPMTPTKPIYTRKSSIWRRWCNLLRLDPDQNPYAVRSAKKLFWEGLNGR